MLKTQLISNTNELDKNKLSALMMEVGTKKSMVALLNFKAKLMQSRVTQRAKDILTYRGTLGHSIKMEHTGTLKEYRGIVVH